MEPPSWSVFGIIGLYSYRFYTGFLSATWLPYLLAMEGQSLWGESQSLFMGVVKLIYACTILVMPFFGWFYDKIGRNSSGIGRRLYLRVGITCGCLGIFLCLWAGPRGYYCTFMFGITMWRLGESLNDITIESIPPKLLPKHQFQVACAIKAALAFLGGMLGYVALYFTTRVHYTWLYYAYLAIKLPAALPTLMLLHDADALGIDAAGPLSRADKPDKRATIDAGDDVAISWWSEVKDAYRTPGTLKGGFPRLQVACFIYMCGTAPVFFLILIIRDVVGITDPVRLQSALSETSIAFLLAAAISAVSTGGGGQKDRLARAALSARTDGDESCDEGKKADTSDDGESRHEDTTRRLMVCVVMLVASAVVTFLLPGIHMWHTVETRAKIFLACASLYGLIWGQGYARFQDLSWRLLPDSGVDVGNAMGYSVMLRNTGTGFGNFVSGAVLNMFPVVAYTGLATASHGSVEPVQYGFMGYVIVCTMCTLTTLLGAYLLWSIPSLIRREVEAKELT